MGRTNRLTAWSYDANGNVTTIPGTFSPMTYDVDNRLTYMVQLWNGGTESYGYRPDHKRLWRVKATGAVEFYLYGPGGERQGIYKWDVDSSGNIAWYLVSLDSVIPKGLQVNRDRLGSVMTSGGTTRWYPYGEESPATAHDQDKFATYQRDTTGLNYADQRYYATTTGRFLTADPYKTSAGASDPGSWNRYAYVQGDPVNFYDPQGLARAPIYVETPPMTVTASAPGVPLVDIIGTRRDPSTYWEQGGTFIPLALERELRCERASTPELSNSELESFLGGVEMDEDERSELFGADGKSGSERDVLPAFAVAAATAANWVVYWARTPQGQYYIGVTSDFAGRRLAHAAKGLNILPIQGITSLNYAAAKGVEQNLIESFRRNGQVLVNKINSISSANPYYTQFTQMGGQVLRSCRAKLPAGFPWP